MCPARGIFLSPFQHIAPQNQARACLEKKAYARELQHTSVLGPNSELDSEAPTRDVRHGAQSKSRGYTLEISTARSNPEVGIIAYKSTAFCSALPPEPFFARTQQALLHYSSQHGLDLGR